MVTKIDCGKCDTAEMMVELKKRGYVVIDKKDYEQLSSFGDPEAKSLFEMISAHYEQIAERKISPIWLLRKTFQNEIDAWVSEMVELREEEKPTCFGCYGYRVCVSRTTPPSSCPWEQRCYNSQRDS